MCSIPFLKLFSLFSNSNLAKLFPTRLLWPATEYHRQAVKHTTHASRFRWLRSAHLSLFGTRLMESKWHVPPLEPHRFLRRRANLICSPTIDIFCTNFRGSLVPIVFFVIINSSYNIQRY